MRKLIALLVTLSGVTLFAANAHGPEKGTLVIVGGNMQDPAIVKRFIDIAGGPDAPIVIIPTAGEADDDYDNYWSGLKQWRENGAKNLTVIHTRDRKVADSEAFVKPIRAARGVFFGGGRQWRPFVHVRDVVRSPAQAPVTSVVAPAVHVDAGLSLLDAVSLMRARQAQLVLVEGPGGPAGIVTMEDLLERVLGRFEDETDA